MTILLGVTAIPKNNSAPYVMIGADSKAHYDNGTQAEDFQKVFKPISNIIYAIAGRFNLEFNKFLHKLADENFSEEANLKDITNLFFTETKQFSRKYSDNYFEIILGGFIDGIPTISDFSVNVPTREEKINYGQNADDTLSLYFGGSGFENTSYDKKLFYMNNMDFFKNDINSTKDIVRDIIVETSKGRNDCNARVLIMSLI